MKNCNFILLIMTTASLLIPTKTGDRMKKKKCGRIGLKTIFYHLEIGRYMFKV